MILDKSNLITIREASRITGYGTEYIRELLRSGQIKGEKFGWSWMVFRDSIERYAQEHRKENGK